MVFDESVDPAQVAKVTEHGYANDLTDEEIEVRSEETGVFSIRVCLGRSKQSSRGDD